MARGLNHSIFSIGIAGDVHFDDAEKFTVNNAEEGVDLSWVALHELGHSLGLEHSSIQDAIMYPIYQGYQPGLKLHRDDILGIQQIYGALYVITLKILLSYYHTLLMAETARIS